MRVQDLGTRLLDARANAAVSRQLRRVEDHLRACPPSPGARPVVVFNASTRIHRLSLNAAFGLLAAWGVRLAGHPVIHAFCDRGQLQCPLGTNRLALSQPPPCRHCAAFSRRLFPFNLAMPMPLEDPVVSTTLAGLADASMDALARWEASGLPLGELVLPTVRWVLRRHDLPDDESVRALVRSYLASAASLAARWRTLLDRLNPEAVVVFNGVMFPEAVARQVALAQRIRVVTHEVGLRPYSAFFSHEMATFREVTPEEGRSLTPEEDRRLGEYLANRAAGQFSMAGIRFWPEMTPLPDDLQARLAGDGRPVVVFTNVVFDTSQVHANTLYPSMFAWLEDLRGVIDRHPDRTFILRAHPDEDRPGKESQQSVAAWVRATALDRRPNVAFLPPAERVSSYELMTRAELVLVYNSSIGLEASIAGRPVLCAGRARYTGADAAYTPATRDEYVNRLETLLVSPEAPPSRHAANARRFLHFELYRASSDFSSLLKERPGFPGMVEWTSFEPEALSHSKPLDVVVRGVLRGEPFHLPPSAE